MKATLNRIALTTCMALGATAAKADENSLGLIWGQTGNNIQQSNALNANLGDPGLYTVIDGAWAVRFGQRQADGRYYLGDESFSDSHGGYQLRPQNLLSRDELFLPLVGNGNQASGGASAGLLRLEQESPGFSRDSDVGLAADLQAGIVQELTSNT